MILQVSLSTSRKLKRLGTAFTGTMLTLYMYLCPFSDDKLPDVTLHVSRSCIHSSQQLLNLSKHAFEKAQGLRVQADRVAPGTMSVLSKLSALNYIRAESRR